MKEDGSCCSADLELWSFSDTILVYKYIVLNIIEYDPDSCFLASSCLSNCGAEFHEAGLGHQDEVASGGSIAYNGTEVTQGSFHINVRLHGEVENTHRHCN